MSAGWLPDLHGLRVHLGARDSRGHWIRLPSADFTCRHGCTWATSGVAEVARFAAVITQHHARLCPGPREET
jgi:hypothetical protein